MIKAIRFQLADIFQRRSLIYRSFSPKLIFLSRKVLGRSKCFITLLGYQRIEACEAHIWWNIAARPANVTYARFPSWWLFIDLIFISLRAKLCANKNRLKNILYQNETNCIFFVWKRAKKINFFSRSRTLMWKILDSNSCTLLAIFFSHKCSEFLKAFWKQSSRDFFSCSNRPSSTRARQRNLLLAKSFLIAFCVRDHLSQLGLARRASFETW